MLHNSLLHWHGMLHSTLHGHWLLRCSLLLWHGRMLLLWPWLLVQLSHCSLLQSYCLLLQCTLLLVQCILLPLQLVQCFNKAVDLWLAWPFLHWRLLMRWRRWAWRWGWMVRWLWRWLWLWQLRPSCWGLGLRRPRLGLWAKWH